MLQPCSFPAIPLASPCLFAQGEVLPTPYGVTTFSNKYGCLTLHFDKINPRLELISAKHAFVDAPTNAAARVIEPAGGRPGIVGLRARSPCRV
jgi:hypothetical protein